MSGDPRYQPKSLQPYFGYDNLTRPIVEVELAVMKTLGDLGIIPQADMQLLTPDVESKLISISMSEVDRVERSDTEYGKATNHDIRALVRIMQSILPEPLRRWVHVLLTSYDALDTARTLMYLRAHEAVLEPKARELIFRLSTRVRKFMHVVQIGRTHGQHALPITVGFWFATILNRALVNFKAMNSFAADLKGKISGAVGAYNAQKGLGFYKQHGHNFEDLVLERLGLTPGKISTQILQPEPLAYYLFSVTLFSAALGQLGRDGRNLMRTEIGELGEPFEEGQVGSSTMAHKRNPLHYENTDGMFIANKNHFMNVFDTLISEHQRDLVGSSLMRSFPAIIVRTVYQLETLLRPGKKDTRSFIERVTVDEVACKRNLALQGDLILAEPMYIALQMAGYAGDAHALINERAVTMVRESGTTLFDAVRMLAVEDEVVGQAWQAVPQEVKDLFKNPAGYIGAAEEVADAVCTEAEALLRA